MHSSLFALTAVVALGVAASVGAQTIGYNVRTGDVWVDNRLGEINDYGNRNRDPFINEMVTNYGAPRPFVTDLLGTRHWSPADVYYACSMAHSVGRPCSEVVDRYDHDRGHGWGAVARSYGIKPGSPEFFALKRGMVGTYGRWGHPIVMDRDEHVRWDSRPMHGDHKVKYKHGHGHGDGNDMDGGHDQSDDKGHGHGHGKGHDQSDDKGHGHDNGNGHAHGKK
ncbi:MAG: hypothetical protein ABIT64_00700 [Lysobacteraceae bacterium]